MTDQKNRLGIMVCYGNNQKHPPFKEHTFFEQLTLEGKKQGLEVFIFNPGRIHWKTRTVPAWHYHNQRWKQQTVPLPYLIYDRCYYVNARHYMKYKPHVQKITQDPQIRLLGRALGGKYQTYLILKEHPEIRTYLPETKRLTHAQELFSFLRKHNRVLIKPNGGSHGRGVVAIEQIPPSSFLLKGRTKFNRPFSVQFETLVQLSHWVEQTIRDTRYILQPLLSLNTPDGRPFDVRILVQKNGQKRWETTGHAIRTGQPDSITSNLHGGGQALPFQPFLKQHYTPQEAAKISSTINYLSEIVPPFIESRHGPLVELGIDIGIDENKDVWIIEVNSKPGRSVFLKTGELEVRRRAIQFPIQYANALLNS